MISIFNNQTLVSKNTQWKIALIKTHYKYDYAYFRIFKIEISMVK